MRKRFYILFVARDAEGQLRKIPIPLHYLYVFLAGALIGMFTITGMAGSYTRMLWKVASFNQLRSEKNALQSRYQKLEQSNHEKDIQVASLGSLANEVSVIYGLKPNAKLLKATEGPVKPEDGQVFHGPALCAAHHRSFWSGYRGSRLGYDPQCDPERVGQRDLCSQLVAGHGPDYRLLRRTHRPVQR